MPPGHAGKHRVNTNFDIVVVGAGPGGLAAAATAAEARMSVCLVDDNPACGGQIWRSCANRGLMTGPAANWVARFSDRVEVRTGSRVVSAIASSSRWSVRLEREEKTCDIRCAAIILATGSRERFLPFPGWTLPGVFGAGGLQAFVKSGLDIRGKRIVVAGTGPLLLAVSAGLRKAGAHVTAVVEQARLAQLARFSLSLVPAHLGKIVEGARYAWTTLGIPYLTRAWVAEVSGMGRVQKVTVASGQRLREFDADMLAIGYHLVPNVELAQMMQCELENGFVKVNGLQATSVGNIYCVGEATGIGGVEKALIEGRIAALAASGQPDRARTLLPARDRQKRFAARLDAAFALRDELRTLPADETIVCRCEDVTHGEIRTCHSWRQAKLHTRCGMGPCQGRICGSAGQFLYGWTPPLPRPPIFPVPVEGLAAVIENSASDR
jgi:NADPH-dependent 2,4-dienoyl-CoA reductase/sulfur reductase-like enzyme